MLQTSFALGQQQRDRQPQVPRSGSACCARSAGARCCHTGVLASDPSSDEKGNTCTARVVCAGKLAPQLPRIPDSPQGMWRTPMHSLVFACIVVKQGYCSTCKPPGSSLWVHCFSELRQPVGACCRRGRRGAAAAMHMLQLCLQLKVTLCRQVSPSQCGALVWKRLSCLACPPAGASTGPPTRQMRGGQQVAVPSNPCGAWTAAAGCRVEVGRRLHLQTTCAHTAQSTSLQQQSFVCQANASNSILSPLTASAARRHPDPPRRRCRGRAAPRAAAPLAARPPRWWHQPAQEAVSKVLRRACLPAVGAQSRMHEQSAASSPPCRASCCQSSRAGTTSAARTAPAAWAAKH